MGFTSGHSLTVLYKYEVQSVQVPATYELYRFKHTIYRVIIRVYRIHGSYSPTVRELCMRTIQMYSYVCGRVRWVGAAEGGGGRRRGRQNSTVHP
jgi:predicted cation transporter